MKFGPVVQEEMSCKDISYLELWWPFCYAEQNHLCNFGRGYQEEQFCEIILNLEQCFRRRSCLKIFLIWSSGSPFVQHLCNFGRRYHEEQFCEIILNLDLWFRRKCHSKIFFIWISGSPFVQYSVTICTILLEGILRNNSVIFF